MAEALQTRHKIDLAAPEFQKVYREFMVDRAGIDKDARTVALSFASENPVERWFGREILDVSTDGCDLTRLKNGGAILVNHDWDDQVGVCIECSIDPATKKARAVAKFSRSQRGEDIFQDIADGIRSLVSVGYIVRKMVLQSVDDGLETHRVTDWQPYEVSIVAVPADTSVGVGRSQPKEEAAAPAASITLRKMETTTTVTPGVVDHLARVKEINAAAKVIIQRHPQHAEVIRDLVAKCSETGDDVNVFTRSVLTDVLKTDAATPATRQGNALIGMKEKDLRRYSVLRAIRAKMNGEKLEGLERECSDEVAKKLERQPTGFFLPDEVVYDTYQSRKQGSERTLLAGSAPDGGYTVGSQLLESEFVSYLRNNTRVIELGARYISGLIGDISIPRQLTGTTAYWVGETGTITGSSPTFGQIVAKPRRIGTSVPYSKQFLAQSSLGAESFVINDSDAATAVELDRVALRGAGGAEPLGITNLASAELSTGVTFGGAATWAKYLEFWTSVAGSNALLGNPAYLANPTAAAKAMTIQKFATYGDPIWQDDKVGVFRAAWSTQIPTTASPIANQVIFGDFSQVVFCEWAGRDVIVDPYGTNATGGTVTVTIQRLIDMVIRRAKSFAVSTDSGAQ